MNLGLNPTFEFRIGTRGLTESQLQGKRVEELLAGPPKVLQEHIAPTNYNMTLLKSLGLNRFVLTLRDPRDVICSLRHHLHRDGAKKVWHIAMAVASGLIDNTFYEHTRQGQMDILIDMAFPKLQSWTEAWLPWLDDPALIIHLIRYDDFARDNEAVIRETLQFLGAPSEGDIELPAIDRNAEGIDLSTHYRRGISGAYMDELSPEQVRRLEKQVDQGLYRRMGWI